MARCATLIGSAIDIHGAAWDVRESRPTAHGWPVLIGWPQSVQRGKGGCGPRIIPTAPLIEYLAATRLRDVNLPISTGPVKRLRREAGISWLWDDWWAARAVDLRTLTLAEFAEKHQCSVGAASQRRAKLEAI